MPLRVLGLRRPRRRRDPAVRRAAARRAGRPGRARVLVLVDPAAKLLEIVTGAEARRVLDDAEVELAALTMQTRVRGRRPGRRHHPGRAPARRARPPPADPARRAAPRARRRAAPGRVRPVVRAGSGVGGLGGEGAHDVVAGLARRSASRPGSPCDVSSHASTRSRVSWLVSARGNMYSSIVEAIWVPWSSQMRLGDRRGTSRGTARAPPPARSTSKT